ncbi:alanine racemase [Propionispora vibrioides]|uniref:Alanine racemase n=1 Tax=Propionispora vibrioides TaxID=112903 RepID=A0A1H8XC77_9FIRM|nr:alanine racemase [Propionispora vibrioides]SEP37422.1 alanine racemase [Propionispora vibrioides]
MLTRPVWAEINMAAIEHNIRNIKALLQPKTKFCAVVKADGYGHGAVEVARLALKEGADYLAVALLSEAIELRQAGVTAPLLILGYTPPEQAQLLVAYQITQTVYSEDMVRALSRAATHSGKLAKVHIKIDTGMGRIGIRPEEAVVFARFVRDCPGLELEGVFSHLAAADSQDKSYAYRQYALFTAALRMIEEAGIAVPLRHIANSAAILDLPDMQLDMVRPGIILYGLLPSAEVQPSFLLEPAMKLKARISHIKEVPAGTAISYGCTFVTDKPSVIATLPVGYADGWSRLMAGKASLLVRGRRAPLVGRVCMDQCMIDVTHIPEAGGGDEVLLFGGAELPADEVARHMGTINYEVVCMVSKRVPRIYIRA